MPYDRVKPREVRAVIGDTVTEPVSLRAIAAEVARRWDTYYILPQGAAYVGDDEVLSAWHGLLGQNVIELADLDAVSETIALTIGLGEDTVDLDTGLADLADVGSDAAPVVSRALAAISDMGGSRRAAADGLQGCDRGTRVRREEAAHSRGGDRGHSALVAGTAPDEGGDLDRPSGNVRL
jgi:hypothetical protein